MPPSALPGHVTKGMTWHAAAARAVHYAWRHSKRQALKTKFHIFKKLCSHIFSFLFFFLLDIIKNCFTLHSWTLNGQIYIFWYAQSLAAFRASNDFSGCNLVRLLPLFSQPINTLKSFSSAMRLASSINIYLEFGMIPTRPISRRSASQQVLMVGQFEL